MTWISVLFAALLIGLLIASGCVSVPVNPVPAGTTPAPLDRKTTCVVGIDGDYPPFTYVDQYGNFQGFDVDSARWIAEREGFDLEFAAVPWDGIIPALQAGEIDMIYSGMTVTPERQQLVNFTSPYFSANQSLAIRAGSRITVQEVLTGNVSIGAQAGSTGARWVEDNLVLTGKMPADRFRTYPDLTALIAGLGNGSVDATIYDAPSHRIAIRGKTLGILYEIITNEQYAVAVRKTDTRLLAAMNEGIRQLKQDPHWKTLLQKYHLS
jgi:polar amino acid transport system substrate-binding protein